MLWGRINGYRGKVSTNKKFTVNYKKTVFEGKVTRFGEHFG